MNKIASVLTGICSPYAKLRLPVLMALALVAVALFVGACSKDEASGDLFPTQPLPETQDWLFDVYGTSPNNIYAAGAKGVMFRYDGNEQNNWVKVEVGTNKAITHLWGSGDGTLYATGHAGVILKSTGGAWSNMTTGTSKDLFAIGRMRSNIYACGLDGTLLKLNGSTWGGTPGLTWILDENDAPTDSLEFNTDVPSLTTVNSFFLGGAYLDPRYTGELVGMQGTKGGIFEISVPSIFPPPDFTDPENPLYNVLPNWILRPLSGEQIVDAEWMLSSTSDPADLSRNYLGTSEGWLFQLSDDQGDTVWTKFYPSVTEDLGAGISDIWLDALQNIYMVTTDGQIIYQTADYNFTDETGYRTTLYDGPVTLTGIWGVDPNQFYVVGYMDEMLMRCSHIPGSEYFNFVDIPVTFPDDKAMEPGPIVDKFGRPLW